MTNRFPRAAGILLHPTSLPGRHGIGDLGPAAHEWVEFLRASGSTLWQILPLGPTGFGDSPYQSFSSFAGNPNLVSPEALRDDGLLDEADLSEAPGFPADTVDFGPVIAWKRTLLERAWQRFRAARGPLHEAFDTFVEAHAWLEDFALFMALAEAFQRPWNEWDTPLAHREPKALDAARARFKDAIELQRFRQFAFFRQWSALREHAHQAGVRIVGDVPIFVSYDSADVWAHRELFLLDAHGAPTVVAGVPPDYFSATGQRWGNPLYDWDRLEAGGYAWWIDRLRATFEQVDLVRIDHFRGFASSWHVPADAPTAETGRWVEGPGRALFDAARQALGELPVIAEDLGNVTPEMEALRDGLGFPGMKILQFAFGGDARDPFLPHNYHPHVVVYTGTHDNDTTRGWYEHSSAEKERDRARRYMGVDGGDIVWDLIRLAYGSVADTAIVPLQDVLDLGAEARMNLPGREAGNWGWRFSAEQLGARHAERLAEFAELYGRRPAEPVLD